MTESLTRTFDFLTTAGNVHAVDVLIYALDSPEEDIREKAGIALLRRAATRGQIETIRRFDQLPERVRDMILDQQPGRLTAALGHCLTHGDEQLCTNGQDLLLQGEYYDLVPTLLQMMESDQPGLRKLGGALLAELVNRLYEHMHSGRDGSKVEAGQKTVKRAAMNAAKTGRMVLSQFETALKNFERMRYPDGVVEAALALGCVDHEAARKVLLQSPPLCRELASRILMTSRHPGVMQFVLDLMARGFPPPRALQTIQERTDPEFVCHLLRCFPKNLSVVQQKNYHQLESIAWLVLGWPYLESIPAGLHGALVSFVTSTGVPQREKTSVHQWIIRHGSAEGRLASAEVLSVVDDRAVKTALYQNLESGNEDAQAWATSQLRARGVPEAVKLLVERLDSPLESVRNAAREELHSFDLDLMLNLFEDLDSTICLRAGEIIRKTDPDCIDHLRKEISGPVARKRMQAARAALALGMHVDVLVELLAMARHDDALLRRTAAEILGHLPAQESREILQELLNDPNPHVRDAAENSLESLLAGVVLEHQESTPQVSEANTSPGEPTVEFKS